MKTMEKKSTSTPADDDMEEIYETKLFSIATFLYTCMTYNGKKINKMTIWKK